MAAHYLAQPGDILLCKGLCADSCVVSAWSLSPYSHIAVIGPDLHVYDITPIEHERRMTIPEYVASYEGYVSWRAIKTPMKPEDWGDLRPVEFREALVPYLGALCSENAMRTLFERVQGTYPSTHMFCSEYVAEALKLPDPRLSHPMNFAPGGRYSDLFFDEVVALN